MILLLLLTNSNIPDLIIDYLAGLKATTCSFNIIPFKDIPGFHRIIEYLDSAPPRKELDYFGIFSGSTFSNNFSLIWILIIIATIHLLFIILRKLINENAKTVYLKCIKWIEKLHQFLTFNIYIRLLLEANIFLLLSSFNELQKWKASKISEIVSILIAFSGAWIWIIFVALSLIGWYSNKNKVNMDSYIPLKEFFNGIKNTNSSKLYSTFLLSRRLIFVVLLVFGEYASSITLICPMIIMQVIYLGNIIKNRPFKLSKNNVQSLK